MLMYFAPSITHKHPMRFKPSTKSIIGLIGFASLGYAIWRFNELVGYLLISVALSFVGRPLVLLLQRIKVRGKQFPSSFGAAIALAFMVGLSIGLTQLFAPLFAEQAQAVQGMNELGMERVADETLSWIDHNLNWLNLSGNDQPNSLFLLEQIQGFVQLEGIGSFFGTLLQSVGDGFVAVFSILFMTFFFLKDGALFRNMIEAVTPDELLPKINSIMDRTSALLTRYFGGLVVQVAIITTIVSLGLSIIGAPNAFLIGFMAGIFNLVPYIGPMAGTCLGLLLIATSSLSIPSEMTGIFLGSLGVFAVAQLVDNFFTQPVIFANRVHAHPLEIFIVISIAGNLAGAAGMVLAIPAYTLFRIVGQELFSGFKVIDELTKNLEG
jgi:predicted PurR-regulated permease PerM